MSALIGGKRQESQQYALDINQIMNILPHRSPFLLIDAVTELVPGESVTAIKNVTINEPFFVGHFPGQPVMPGVLIIEALAQTGACAILSMPENRGKVAFLTTLDKTKIRKKVTPGDQLLLKVDLVKMRDRAGIGKAVATVNGKKVAETELGFVIG